MSFSVYRSSAGSGKTYTLVKEYLAIVLKQPAKFRNVLAITFTNKAANEMRERILKALTEISEPETYAKSGTIKDMLPELVTKCGLEKEVLVKNAGTALRMILHNYQDFSVSTIDSFIHRIVRTFAFDLHLPLNFEVETDEDAMVGMAVDMLLDQVGLEKEPTQALKGYTEARISDEKNWDIEKDLKKFAKRLLKDDIAEFLPDLLKMDSKMLLETSKKLYALTSAIEKELSRLANELMAIWEKEGLTVDDFFQKKSGVWGYIDRLVNRDYSKLEFNSYVSKTLGEDHWYSAKIDADIKVKIDALKDEMISRLGNISNYMDEQLIQYKRYNLLKKNIFPLAVLSEIEKILVQIRLNDGIVHISDMDKRIANVVNKESIPFIYERLGEKYNYFLIDEFQDTSVLEWQNLLPLIENSLSEAHFNMIVGDAKQAIYRFKGGDVEQLVQLPEIYRKGESPEMDDRENALRRNYQAEKLNYNFRSCEEIINFNNELYALIKDRIPEGIKPIYADAHQKMMKKKVGGEIRISFIDSDGNVADKEPIYYKKILEEIRTLTAEGSFRLKDIAILCRSNANASKIARYLLENGIDVVSAESLLLKTSPEVNFLLNCLDYIADSGNRVAITYMLNYLVRNKEEGKLKEILKQCLSGGPTELASFLKANHFDFLPESLRQMGLYERVEAIIRCFRINAAPDPYILFFLDTVYDFTLQSRYPMEDFTVQWRANSNKYSIVVPDGLDAVKVMTIHKAKGLEFPVVIYPFANNTASLRGEQKWTHLNDPSLQELHTVLLPVNSQLEGTEFEDIYVKEQEMVLLDLLNILYVATTRPTHKLYILCDLPSEKPNIKSIPSIIRNFLEDKEKWQEGVTEYSWGELNPPDKKDDTNEETLNPKLFISSDWRKNIRLSGHADIYWDLEEDARNLEWGNLVHDILSKIETAADLDKAIGDEVVQGNISDQKASELKRLMLNMLETPEIKPFFDGSYVIKNEAAILKYGGGEYRPDRLMIKGDKAIILDYKTGREDPKHFKQLDEYGELLDEMGFQHIEKYLLYLDDDPRLLRV